MTYAIENFDAHAEAEALIDYALSLGLSVSNVSHSVNRNNDNSSYFTFFKERKYATVRVSDHLSNNTVAMWDLVGHRAIAAARHQIGKF